jgi:hypothetical protein
MVAPLPSGARRYAKTPNTYRQASMSRMPKHDEDCCVDILAPVHGGPSTTNEIVRQLGYPAEQDRWTRRLRRCGLSAPEKRWISAADFRAVDPLSQPEAGFRQNV